MSATGRGEGLRAEFEKWVREQPRCLDKCDGDLPGEKHDEDCPVRRSGSMVNFTDFDIWQAAHARGFAAARERVAQVDFAEIINQHETNYTQLGKDLWVWMCRCNRNERFDNRDLCVARTREHWQEEITAAILSLQPEE